MSALTQVVVDQLSFYQRDWQWLAIYGCFWTALHLLFQHGLPAFNAGIYDAFVQQKEGEALVVARKRAAQQMRSKCVATIQALICVPLALYGLLAPETQPLLEDLYGSTDLTRHIVLFNVAYFGWDCYACFVDRETVAYWAHGIVAFLMFSAGMRPFNQHQALVGMMYESSTPFLHVRSSLLLAKKTDHPAFSICTVGFALVFFLARIAFGYPMAWFWFNRLYKEMQSGTAASVPTSVFFMVAGVFMCILNAYWMSLMVKSVLRLKKKGKSA